VFLRDSLIYFYPERRHIVQQAQELAADLGYELEVPELSWKYSWIPRLLSWHLVKPTQQALRKVRWTFERRVDKALFSIESRNPNYTQE
jgi:hypothetical protein